MFLEFRLFFPPSFPDRPLLYCAVMLRNTRVHVFLPTHPPPPTETAGAGGEVKKTRGKRVKDIALLVALRLID